MSTLTDTISKPILTGSDFNLATVLRRVIATEDRWAPTVARLALGLVMMPHGLQKTVGTFGGYGFSGTMGFFTEAVGLPWVVALAVILAESLGALALILGVGGRIAAAGIAAVMIGAIVTTHASVGFFMNWFGNQPGEGFEYHLLALGLAAVVLVAGSGKLSIDAALEHARRR
jgi:putative oxidoreductase